MRNLLLAGVAALSCSLAAPAAAHAQADDPYIGDIIVVGFNFCPRGWAQLGGQLLPINGNESLFSIIGTTYGGDGRTTLGLPDMRGRVPVGAGQGPGLSFFQLGQRGGSHTHTLTEAHLPPHNHAAHFSNSPGSTPNPQGATISNLNVANTYATTPNTAFESDTIGITGNNNPIETTDPVLGLRYCMALQGLYPPRN
ncbi:MAG: tail fiber protein [Oceanicaulis sp.]